MVDILPAVKVRLKLLHWQFNTVITVTLNYFFAPSDVHLKTSRRQPNVSELERDLPGVGEEKRLT